MNSAAKMVSGKQLFRQLRRRGIPCATLAQALNVQVESVYRWQQHSALPGALQQRIYHHFPELIS